MNSSNTLYIIASFLDYRSLAVFSTINKLFRKISQNSELWKALLLIEYFGDYDLFGDMIKGEYMRKPPQDDPLWKNILKKRVIFAKVCKQGLNKRLSSDTSAFLSDFLLAAFKDPELPLPKLTRESKSFLTIFQNLISQSMLPPIPSFPSQCTLMLEHLYETIDEIKQDLQVPSNSEAFFMSRWAMGRYCGLDAETVDELGVCGALLSLVEVVKRIVEAHCEASAAALWTISEGYEFLSEYCRRWEAFSASMILVEENFVVVKDIMNIVYNETWTLKPESPFFSFFRPMALIWREVVLDPISSEIHDIILKLFQTQRNRSVILPMGSEAQSFMLSNEECLLVKAVQHLIDLGVHEFSLWYLQHSKFIPPGGYEFIHGKIIKLTEIFYKGLEAEPRVKAKKMFQSDFELIQRAFLPCTWVLVNKMRLEHELNQLRNIFLYEFKDISTSKTPLDEGYPLLYTSFGKTLFVNETSSDCTKKIKLYIDYLSSRKRLNEINEYNQMEELDSYSDQLLQDQELELANANLGVTFDRIHTPEFSLHESI